ncbi:low-density lipoprotein receptor-related protein 4 [Prorops nasuta]|uniref:low-density lipoprotein receptor-related protein 4 n=1 Tax=Prorops nasuta TaxID=863751 RepID=UPI0034CF2336
MSSTGKLQYRCRLPHRKLFILFVATWSLAIVAECSLSEDESTTHAAVNRGAARQMYGSGSLRSTGSTTIFQDGNQKLNRHEDKPGRNDQDSNEPFLTTNDDLIRLERIERHRAQSSARISRRPSHESSLEHDDREGPPDCDWECNKDQFRCVSSCTCINLDGRCDGLTDCENAEDEIDCEEILYERANGTCFGKTKLLCPQTGVCISTSWLCDGENDCGDYSDESHCEAHANCTSNQFACHNGACILASWHCDNEVDCTDGSDETDCGSKKKCDEDEITCSDGNCISRDARCDGEEDCFDGADEQKCEPTDVVCKTGEFKCASSLRCIQQNYRCDRDNDCGDWSDEKNCSHTTATNCQINEFSCASGNCIDEKLVCDKHKDCPDGEDENMCQHLTPPICSPQNEFTCSSGMCVPHQWVCDRVYDCPNGEDEASCPMTCEINQYFCKSPAQRNSTGNSSIFSYWYNPHLHYQCINVKLVCDGIANCPLGDDEANCPKNRECTKQDKCQQRCILTANNETACACELGFFLAPDNYTCHDINECQLQMEPVCSQLCNNTIGSFVCGCTAGYELRPDKRTCKARGSNPYLIFANREDIRQVSLSNDKYIPIIRGTHNAIALSYHYKRKTIFWSDVSIDVIRKVFINGTEAEDVIRWGVEKPSGIAVDWIHDLLFWTDSETRRVEVITLDTRVRHVLVSSDLDKPRPIAVHPNYGYVYWADWGPSPKIERADMDGTGRLSLITESISWPNGLTIDYTTDRIYWADAKHKVIESAHLDGTNRKLVVSRGIQHPFGITIFEDYVYWTDWHLKSILSANKGTGQGVRVIRSGLHFPMDVRCYHPRCQPDYPNHCGSNNGNCSHMCLPNSTGYSCVCPVGLKLRKDGKSCATALDNLLIFTRANDIRLIAIDQSTRAFDTVIPVDHVQTAMGLASDAINETIYWTDVRAGTISKAFLNGTNQTVIVGQNLDKPSGISIDWLTGKLYWTDTSANRIECSNMDGSMRALLVYKDIEKPRDIAVDPISGYMYWTEWGNKSMIKKSTMDGTQRRVLFSKDLNLPNGLTLDYDKKRLYWVDGATKKIEYSGFNGENRTVLIRGLSHPFGMAIHKNQIYWTDWESMSIYRADKDTGANQNVVRSGISKLMDIRVFHRPRKNIENPCERNNGGCSHLCLLKPYPQRYVCACPTGLALQHDGKTCPNVPTKFLIIAHSVDIRIVSFDDNYTTDTVLPVGQLKNVTGVDVDLNTYDVYWTDTGSDVIESSSFDGKTVKKVIHDGIDCAESLVVDSVGKKLYWTDKGLNSIEVSELSGANRKVLISSGLDNPRAIALYYSAGLIFWTDWGHNARIERANMDGEQRTTVIADRLVWPNGLTIDQSTNKLYWNDAIRKVIETSDLLGRSRKILIEGVMHPYGLAIMDDSIYWTDWYNKSLVRANKITGSNKEVVLKNLQPLMDVRAVVRSNYKVEDVCGRRNGGCSHLCLRNPQGYSCACPTGISLNEDGKTCNSTPSNFLLIATLQKLSWMSLDTPEMREVSLEIPDISNIGYREIYSIDFHWKKRLIFYSENFSRMIKAVSMDNLSQTRTIFIGKARLWPFRIAVDWIADNIYFIVRRTMIYVAKLDGSCHKRLVQNLTEVNSIALFPRLGYIFWTELRPTRIQRSTLDGQNIKTIVTSELNFVHDLAIDYQNQVLYWADTSKDRIEKSDLHGLYRIQLVPDIERPFRLALYDHHIYWVMDTMKPDIIERVVKSTGKDRTRIRTFSSHITEVKIVSAKRQTGWTPCSVDNGGCSHFCFFTRKTYICACPDSSNATTTQSCSTIPTKRVPLRKPGTEGDPEYDLDEDEVKLPEIATRPNLPAGSDDDYPEDKFNDKFNREKGYSLRTVVITILTMVSAILAILVMIMYLLCSRKTKQKTYTFGSRRNVLTFSNPNYNASAADPNNPNVSRNNTVQDKRSLVWKRLKYDKSQERVYEDNGQSPSPEVLSLIPQSATPSSSRAASVTPRESPPPLTSISHLNV